MSAPEFARPVPIDRIGAAGHSETIAATGAERAALAARFGWLTLDRLDAAGTMTASATHITAQGTLQAALTQACVVTGEPLPVAIAVPFTVRFVAADAAPEGDDERELDADDLDVMTYEGSAIDLGEAVAQTLALAVDPYPRGAAADGALDGLSAEEAGPFAGLKALLGKGA